MNKNQTKKKQKKVISGFHCKKVYPLSNKIYTCYSPKVLRKILTEKNIVLKPDDDHMELYQKVADLFPNATFESEWIENQADLLNEVFLEKISCQEKDYLTSRWLSNYDINAIMTIYGKLYMNFLYLGTHCENSNNIDPMNPKKCLVNQLCNINMNEWNNYDIIACTFNIAKYMYVGIHWVAVLIDLRKKYIIYFDSGANQIIPENIHNFIQTVNNNYLAFTNTPLTFYQSNRSYQTTDSECGMYCLYFILTLLTTNKHWLEFQQENLTDAYIKSFRSQLFDIKN
jgi:hypothetical protein